MVGKIDKAGFMPALFLKKVMMKNLLFPDKFITLLFPVFNEVEQV